MSISSRVRHLAEGTGAISATASMADLLKMAQEIVAALHDQLPADHQDAEKQLIVYLKKMVTDRNILSKALERMNQPAHARQISKRMSRVLRNWQTTSY